MTTDIALYMVKRPIVVLLLVWFVLYIVRISLFSMKYWFKTKWTVSAFTSCHKERQFSVASVSLGRDLRQGKPAMNAVVPWQCNYSLISNKESKLVDVASWTRWTTWIIVSSLLVLSLVTLCYLNKKLWLRLWHDVLRKYNMMIHRRHCNNPV